MSKSTDLATLIQGLRLYCLAEGRRPSTIRWYMGKLQIFLMWLEWTRSMNYATARLPTFTRRCWK